MTISKQFLFIITLATFALTFSDKADLSRLSLIMRPNDILKVDVRKLINFKSSSINFFSNNPAAKLPGISKKPPRTFAEDRTFAPIILKSKKGRVFVVEEDRLKLLVYDLVGKTELRPVQLDYKFEKHENFKMVIADLHLEEDWLTVLYYDSRDHANPEKTSHPTKYYLFNVNLWDSNSQSIVTFAASWYERPALKLFSPHPTGDDRVMTWLLFDKNGAADGEFSVKKKVSLVKTDFAREGEIDPSNISDRFVNQVVPKLGNTILQLQNVLMTTQGRHMVFFVVQEAGNTQTRLSHVYSCMVDIAEKPADVKFRECTLFRDRVVKQFFLKGPNYIAITNDNTMEFCNHIKNSCREGKVQPNWDLREVLMEGDFAVIVMSIERTKFVFINNFSENSLVWFYDDQSAIVKSYLVFATVNQQPHLFLTEVPEKGLRFRDITFYPYFKIRGSQLKQDQLTNVYLEDKLVLSYDLKPLGDRKVLNLQEDRIVSVLVEPQTGEFRSKLDIVGSNLRFPETGNFRIKYFNQMSMQFKWEGGELKGQYYVFYRNWMFFERAIVKFSCACDKEHMVYFCKEQGKLELTQSIHVWKIRSVEEAGGLLVLIADAAEDFAFFDRDTNALLSFEFPERFKGGHHCMQFVYYVACVYDLKDDKIEYNTLRVFQIEKTGLVEVEGLEASFIASLEQFKTDGHSASENLKSIRVSSFDFDKVQTDRLAVLFILAFEDNNTRAAYVNYIFNNNVNQPPNKKLLLVGRSHKMEKEGELGQGTSMVVLDSQTLFWRFRNRFDLFCQDEDSTYYFEYLEVSELIDVRIVNSHSLVIVIYKGPQEKHFFAIFKITQNAAKQLLRLEEIEQFDENYTLATIVIDEWTLGFYQYNPVTGAELPSYLYFRNGPVIVSTAFTHQMIVNNSPMIFKFAQDKSFDVTRNQMIKSSNIEVSPEKESMSLALKNYFSFEGNMFDIELGSEIKNKGLKVTLDKPLMLKGKEELLALTADSSAKDLLVITSKTHILLQENRSVAKFRVFPRTDPKAEVSIEFSSSVRDCKKVILSSASVLCFWTDGAFPKVSLKSHIVSTDEVTFVLPEELADINVLVDNASDLHILYRDPWNKYLSLLKIDKNGKTFAQKFIGKGELFVDDLNIQDFHFDLNDKDNRLTIIILDAHSNQLLFYHASTVTERQTPVLKRNAYLDPLDNALYKLKCIETDDNSNRYMCMVFSASKVHYLTVQYTMEDGTGISLYRWEVSENRDFYNVMFATALDNTLNVRGLLDPNYLYLYQKDIADCPEPMLVRYVLHDKNAHYSSFALPLKDYKDILLIDYKPPVKRSDRKEVREIEIYYFAGKSLKRAVYRAGDYVLRVDKPFTLDGRRVPLHSYFFGKATASDFSFNFAQKQQATDEAKKTRNLKIVLLIVGIIMVSVLILVALFALLVLFRDRKKIQLGTNQPADETEVDISYM